ncbi:penicillin-insensitive murein endopeptidase [Pseudoduganella lurida]|uniref:Penicillin-insensitive murein endopeptidase n=1 Tax=Pseudoduganella lurida TaxID=1036180 RepID=A0A562RGF0_9BURK|nr:penicillin-insensitive murein endopeptidase [Pseudoduganella lurida]TWI67486.1 penicillin-insensitive murein endopeptidase [Pseudoduganella lurida]
MFLQCPALQSPATPSGRTPAAMRAALSAALLAAALLQAAPALASIEAPPAVASRCFGSSANGRIEDAVRLPLSGPNYAAYSTAGTMAGRTYVHTTVAKIIAGSYALLHQALPGNVFVYGETGAPTGGRFKPHRTHQNGLAADFFVPVRDATGRSVALPTDTPRLGYDIDFDAAGRHGDYTLDFDAMAQHLFRLDAAAHAHGSGIAQVVFDPALLPKLFATPRGAWLKQHLPFRTALREASPSGHYHVEFSLRCAPLRAAAQAKVTKRMAR